MANDSLIDAVSLNFQFSIVLNKNIFQYYVHMFSCFRFMKFALINNLIPVMPILQLANNIYIYI